MTYTISPEINSSNETTATPDESRDQQVDPAEDEPSQHVSSEVISPNEDDRNERKKWQKTLCEMIRKLSRRIEG